MPAAIPIPPGVMNARAKRLARADRDAVRFEWFLNDVSSRVTLTMRQRVSLATNYLMSRVVKNISVPVIRGVGPRSKRHVVIERSKPGEFPRVETATLMRGIFAEVVETSPGVIDGFVGTPHDYGLILETQLSRSFLVRTLREEESAIAQMIAGPVKE